MNISTLASSLEAGAFASPGAGAAVPGPLSSAAASQGSSGSTSSAISTNTPQPGAQAPQQPQPTASALQKAVQKINQQLEQSSGVTLSAGLDTSGQHPGQVLVELSDKATRQTFFKYYVPASQVVKASENLGSPTGAQGALISAKA
jgi:hypothetical protein